MKKVFIIAAVLIAALPMAHATTYWFTGSGPGVTSSPTTTYSGVTLAGYTFPSGTLGGGGGASTLTGTQSSVVYDSYGAGVASTTPYVTNTSFLVVDFSSPTQHANHSTVDVYLDNVSDGYYIYGGTTASSPFPSTSYTNLTVLASRLIGGAPPGNIANVAITLTKAYDYLIISAAPACHLNVDYITTNATPEPGTFVMAGMVLIGLGMALRKARKS
jgi:hypothetical protein